MKKHTSILLCARAAVLLLLGLSGCGKNVETQNSSALHSIGMVLAADLATVNGTIYLIAPERDSGSVTPAAEIEQGLKKGGVNAKVERQTVSHSDLDLQGPYPYLLNPGALPGSEGDCLIYIYCAPRPDAYNSSSRNILVLSSVPATLERRLPKAVEGAVVYKANGARPVADKKMPPEEIFKQHYEWITRPR